MRFVKFLLVFIPFLSVFLMSQNTFADTYSQATVGFYSDSQHSATVNLPWSVNPGYNTFYLNNVYFNNNAYNNQQLSYINGRVVMEASRPSYLANYYVCGLYGGTDISSDNPRNSYCLGSAIIVYSDSSRTEITNLPVYVYVNSSGRHVIYFDFNGNMESSKQVGFIQFRFYAASGYDVISNNVSWNNSQLFVLIEGRSSITVYETPPSGAEIANELLQQQIGQNNTIINQNQTIIDQNHAYNSRVYEAEDNINNQSSSDIQGAENNQTTNLINIITSFFNELSSFSATDCNLNLPLPSFIGGNTSVNICQGKDVLGNFISLISTLTVLMFYIPLAWILLKMIYNEIRSWTNG